MRGLFQDEQEIAGNTMSFHFEPLELDGLLLITYDRYADARGFFAEAYRESVFGEAGMPPFVQENHALSNRSVLRGLHYQLNPAAQGKLVSCVHGRIFDVAVDIRKGSPTFGQWKGVALSGDRGRMLYMPEGFAHGYCALAPDTVVTYKTTDYWSPEHERAIRWDDPRIAIDWPVPSPIVSEKDHLAPDFDRAENNFE
jgi:dTDP-4-dehydrorhamnose 3,5-epimerase